MTTDVTTTTDESIDVQKARAALATTLTGIEDRINLPKRAVTAARRLRQTRPVVFSLAMVSALAAVGASGWAAFRLLRRR
ncbi:hypothetical protein OSC27_10250 [Microbacterium sp. STN6]|uniref:hypothetical protein n=1 Tax=Microbacterium sp. STN6 TaxID=2995588 RepID=UPI0022610233|nr:hypothetical protein [Microbacterium sp. STN6]MCX7522656.1 hypothetical protein [Microbacterium sp. STN6]